MDKRLEAQLAFIHEIDKLKSILRLVNIPHENRKENDAEHSWQLAMMTMILKEYCELPNVDFDKVLRMVLVHDIVEIDAGDTFAYDKDGIADKYARESKAATRIFGLLPEDLGKELHDLWLEYEEKSTSEALMAAAMDRFAPILNNYHDQGGSWVEYGIKRSQVVDKCRIIAEACPRLWDYVESLLNDAEKKGFLLAG